MSTADELAALIEARGGQEPYEVPFVRLHDSPDPDGHAFAAHRWGAYDVCFHCGLGPKDGIHASEPRLDGAILAR